MTKKFVRTKKTVDKWRATLIERYGKVAWNKGLTKDNNEFLKKQSNNMKGHRYTRETEFKQGHGVSDEMKKKMSEKYDYEKHHSESIKKKRSKSMLKRWKDEEYRNRVIKLQRKHIIPNKDIKL